MPDIWFQSRRPTLSLAPYVALLWYWQGYAVPAAAEYVLPTATNELVISLHGNAAAAAVSGPRWTPLTLQRSAEDRMFGIHFNPGGVFPFLDLPANEIADQAVALDDLWRGDAKRLHARLHDARDIEAGFRTLETWLLSKLDGPNAAHTAVKYALRRLTASPSLRMSALSEEVGFSQRRFIQVFKEQVGLAPKLFARLTRFQNVLTEVGNQDDVDWVDVAAAHDYTDQAHLIHEFKDFSGLTPMAYMMRRTGHLNHVRA